MDAESAVPTDPVPAGPAYSEPDAPSYADSGPAPDPALAPPPVPAYAQPVATGVRLHHAPVQATAVRHVATPTQPASDDSQDPMIDKSMILLVGWIMFMLLGGSALAGSATPTRR